MKRNNSADLLATTAKGVLIASDLTLDDKRFVYVRDNVVNPLGESGLKGLFEGCGVSVLRVRPLCVAHEYAITAEAA